MKSLKKLWIFTLVLISSVFAKKTADDDRSVCVQSVSTDTGYTVSADCSRPHCGFGTPAIAVCGAEARADSDSIRYADISIDTPKSNH